jgi:uncharacterized glyoxalase superfamily protein PhnB
LFDKLSQDGMVFMPLAAYLFSEKFGWVADRYASARLWFFWA